MIKKVFFDSTGTLIRVHKGVGFQYAEVARRHGIRVSEAQQKELERSFFAVWKSLNTTKPNFGAWQVGGHTNTSSKTWWTEFVEHTFARTSISTIDIGAVKHQLFEDLYELFKKPEAWETFPDVEPTLQWLRAQGITLGHDILERKNLRQYFDFILLSSEFGTEKPDPDIFRHALKLHTPVEPENAIHIGDHDIKDYVGASTLNINALLLDRDGEMTPAAHIVPNVSAVINLVQQRNT